ncbi:hypothetical protein PPL_06257 [Heterostelium album PN500]|uniref:Uncharacterized protein n=1 Tax=Heterostelium pallidum (strain ATCC 26659 / Pp 5 / PN500) TaxID=670386 RepID=D3BCN2_HETP5|nr:hypothetical protein PPL_06257 [Heterostelium album PN500]EFA80674.1 hypothetical protein PPL_06257 [Heterostelium album PN500]|eukprot:XP_020432794.1 hypothetical protein PPL_06257 [Heterostelium album PN500]
MSIPTKITTTTATAAPVLLEREMNEWFTSLQCHTQECSQCSTTAIKSSSLTTLSSTSSIHIHIYHHYSNQSKNCFLTFTKKISFNGIKLNH